jgi:hypothetical protein
MTTTITKKQLLKTYHSICASKGLQDYEKEAILDGYHVTSSADLSERQLRDVIAKLSNGVQNEGDRWRKRVLASVGAWLEIQGKVNDKKTIVAIALRAAGGYKQFNQIPVSRLRDLYYEFLGKQKVARNVRELPDNIQELEKLDTRERERKIKELGAAMSRAVYTENYEAAAKLRDEINNLKSATL